MLWIQVSEVGKIFCTCSLAADRIRETKHYLSKTLKQGNSC